MDWLHVLSMGVFRHLLGHFTQEVLYANIYDVPGTEENLFMNGTRQLKQDYRNWMTAERKAGKNHTNIDIISHKSFGSKDDPQVTFFGAQTNGFIRCCNDQLVPKADCLGDRCEHFKKCIASCVRLVDLIRQNPHRMSMRDTQDFCNQCKIFLRGNEELCIGVKPKHHSLMEMCVKIRSEGSPEFSSCWGDESLNKSIKDVAKGAHVSVFHVRILATWAFKTRRGFKRAREP